MRRRLPALLIAILASGCSSVPSEGPSASDIGQERTAARQRFELVDLDMRVAQVLGGRRADKTIASFGDYRPSTQLRIGVGDEVTVTIWEAAAGGLFSAPLVADKFTTGSKSATIPPQVVDREGAITVPYAGAIHVAGHTPREVQAAIEQALAGKAIQPQVLVDVPHSPGNTASVLGEVVSGARVPLSVKGDRVLDVIAEAGGVKAPVNETFIELTRRDRSARVALSRVVADHREDIYMRPGDVLTVIRDPQTFIAYGATGRNAEIPFDADGINLNQAIAKAGGRARLSGRPGRGLRVPLRAGERGAPTAARFAAHRAWPADSVRLPAEPARPQQPLRRPALPDLQQGRRLRLQRPVDRCREGHGYLQPRRHPGRFRSLDLLGHEVGIATASKLCLTPRRKRIA